VINFLFFSWRQALASERDRQQQDKYRALAEERERTPPKP
jgi:hypothetical protein